MKYLSVLLEIIWGFLSGLNININIRGRTEQGFWGSVYLDFLLSQAANVNQLESKCVIRRFSTARLIIQCYPKVGQFKFFSSFLPYNSRFWGSSSFSLTQGKRRSCGSVLSERARLTCLLTAIITSSRASWRAPIFRRWLTCLLRSSLFNSQAPVLWLETKSTCMGKLSSLQARENLFHCWWGLILRGSLKGRAQ